MAEARGLPETVSGRAAHGRAGRSSAEDARYARTPVTPVTPVTPGGHRAVHAREPRRGRARPAAGRGPPVGMAGERDVRHAMACALFAANTRIPRSTGHRGMADTNMFAANTQGVCRTRVPHAADTRKGRADGRRGAAGRAALQDSCTAAQLICRRAASRGRRDGGAWRAGRGRARAPGTGAAPGTGYSPLKARAVAMRP